MQDFVDHPCSRAAGLSPAHVVRRRRQVEIEAIGETGSREKDARGEGAARRTNLFEGCRLVAGSPSVPVQYRRQVCDHAANMSLER
eukprot:6208568-Pleurochrysis_carterae.AAC.3